MLIFLGWQVNVLGQSFTQMMDFADEKVAEGDYFYAIKYYRKAMEIDSNSVMVLWKFAEAQRRYKDYEKAEFYYRKVYNKENGLIYPMSVFWLASMEMQNGKYAEAIKHWKLAKKTFKREREGYAYKKSQQAFIACLWAQKAIEDTSGYIVNPLPQPVNSIDAELAPMIYENQIWFTSLKADSINSREEVHSEDYSLQIYSAELEGDSFNNLNAVKGVQEKGKNSANGSVSPDGKRFYFSRCNENFACKIYVGKLVDGKVKDLDSLGEIINQPEKITTMPHSTIINGVEYLFFVSNRDKSFGGLDIWYSQVKNGNQYGTPVNLGKRINSLDDEVSPFFDTLNQKLYFSSSWWEGFGGMDIFESNYKDGNFENPKNLGIPINSSQNDTYFIIDQKKGEFYYSSNRVGVKYVKNPTCCNDIFKASKKILPPPTRFETLTELNSKLPVTLFFHNDEPNPKTRDTSTHLTYIETYESYIGLENKYKREYAKGLSSDEAEDAKEDIDDFFTEFVAQGVRDLEEFIRLLVVELERGYQIEVTVKGFASPLAKTDYNVNLTKRRIASLINYLEVYEDGKIKPYLNNNAENGGSLSFVQIPFGEYTADALVSDNVNDQKNSVYSRKAALERKIEIQSVSFINQDSSYAKLTFDNQIHDFGKVNQGEKLRHQFSFTNSGEEWLLIESLEADCSCITYSLSQNKLAPGETASIIVSWDTNGLNGKQIRQIKIIANVENKGKEIAVTAEVE